MGLEHITKHLNFFRYHLLFFTFTPLIFSALLYAGNGSASGNANEGAGVRKVEYVDSLFLCFSAMTVTGLVTVNLSAIHPFQQFLLFFLFVIGDYTFVSLIMVLVRKRFFRNHCEQLLRRTITFQPSRTKTMFGRAFTTSSNAVRRKAKVYKGEKISAPVDARPVGDYVSERGMVDSPVDYRHERPSSSQDGKDAEDGNAPVEDRHNVKVQGNGHFRDGTDQSGSTTPYSSALLDHYEQPGSMSHSHSPTTGRTSQSPADIGGGPTDHTDRVIQFVENGQIPPSHRTYHARQRIRAQSRGMTHLHPVSSHHSHPGPTGITLRHSSTISPPPPQPPIAHIPFPIRHEHTGFGGFPSPLRLLQHAIPPSTKATLHQRLSRPHRQFSLLVNTLEHPEHKGSISDTDREANPSSPGPGKPDKNVDWDDNVRAQVARWMPKSLGGIVIGRNSRFFTEELEDEELEQLGGVEYRALRLLSYLVPAYIAIFQLVPFAIIAIYFSQIHRWDAAFQGATGVQANTVNKTWWALYMSVSAYTGSGMSLVDQNMSPFSSCYLLIFCLIIIMLAGNHALPMMLRFVIWVGTKIWRKGEINETLHFLLDHPRRCFLYLFPSHQTWYLVFVLVAFMCVELFGFLVLNIGLPVLSQLGGFQMFAAGLLQSLSVRAAGFGIVSIAAMSPSVLFLYIILMYVAIYPIAMSVRSTNVYEERALGVYEPEDPEMNGDSEPAFQGRRREVFSKYLAWHMRRQLAFDIWPLTLAIFLICIAERGKILDPSKSAWFTIFRIIFECTSAYSTIGLTMGTPNNNYSFSGELSTVSKLIMIVVMLRGRHRGLPVAIDRAIILPHEFARIDRRSKTDKDEVSTEVPATVAGNQQGRLKNA